MVCVPRPFYTNTLFLFSNMLSDNIKKRVFLIRIIIHAVISCALFAWITGTTIYFHKRFLKNHETIKVRLIDYSRPSFLNFESFLKNGQNITNNDAHKYVTYFKIIADTFPKTQADTILGCLYAMTDNPLLAEKAFLRALQHNSRFFWTRYNLGLVYFHEGQYRQAIDSMKAALASNPAITVADILSSQAYMQILRRPATAKTKILFTKSIIQARLQAQQIITASFYLSGDITETFQVAIFFLQQNNPKDPQLTFWRNLAYSTLQAGKDTLQDPAASPYFLKLKQLPFQFF